MGRMEVITRVERRRRYSDEERAAVLVSVLNVLNCAERDHDAYL